ncbi:unnamed protein product [Lactuca virosa]|uniref:Uncharacterized protein n=1 Tax=Lactuca virosa TaxID=75947 RepID=A0AAU9NJY7_9ASTR|nr:unnamed protein product [Lactuca virosa]
MCEEFTILESTKDNCLGASQRYCLKFQRTKPGGIANMVISQMPLYCSTRCKHKGCILIQSSTKLNSLLHMHVLAISRKPPPLSHHDKKIKNTQDEVNNNRPKESNNDLPVTWNTTEGGFRKRK